jgi:hypothetical protein
MENNKEERFSLTIEEGRITLRAKSFRAEKGSVLHSGIFSRELATSFVSAVLAVGLLIYFALSGELRLLHYILAVILFGASFPFVRFFVFKEPYLETTFDIRAGDIAISLKRPLLGKTIRRSLAELQRMDISHVRIEPENPDAIAFVEKIALQHGTVIPGFGEVQEFYNLDLDFGDAKHTILTTIDRTDVEGIAEKIKSFIT